MLLKPGMKAALEAALGRGEGAAVRPHMREVWPTGLDEAAIPAAKAESSRMATSVGAPAYGDELGNAMFDASLSPGSGLSREQLLGMSLSPELSATAERLPEAASDPMVLIDQLEAALGRKLSDEELQQVLSLS